MCHYNQANLYRQTFVVYHILFIVVLYVWNSIYFLFSLFLSPFMYWYSMSVCSPLRGAVCDNVLVKSASLCCTYWDCGLLLFLFILMDLGIDIRLKFISFRFFSVFGVLCYVTAGCYCVWNLIRTLCRYLFLLLFLPAISENLHLFWVLVKIVEQCYCIDLNILWNFDVCF